MESERRTEEVKGGQYVNGGISSIPYRASLSLPLLRFTSLSLAHPPMTGRVSLLSSTPATSCNTSLSGLLSPPICTRVCMWVCVRGELSAPDTHSPVGAVVGEGAYGDARSPHHPPLLSHSKYHSNGRLRISIFCPWGDLNASRARGVPVRSCRLCQMRLCGQNRLPCLGCFDVAKHLVRFKVV